MAPPKRSKAGTQRKMTAIEKRTSSNEQQYGQLSFGGMPTRQPPQRRQPKHAVREKPAQRPAVRSADAPTRCGYSGPALW